MTNITIHIKQLFTIIITLIIKIIIKHNKISLKKVNNNNNTLKLWGEILPAQYNVTHKFKCFEILLTLLFIKYK